MNEYIEDLRTCREMATTCLLVRSLYLVTMFGDPLNQEAVSGQLDVISKQVHKLRSRLIKDIMEIKGDE